MEDEQMFEVEEVDIEEQIKRGERVPHARRYAIRVDKQRVVTEKARITGAEILALVSKTSETHKLYQHKKGHQPSLIGPSEVVDLANHGVERFTTMPKDTTEGLDSGAHRVRRQFQLPESEEADLARLDLCWETINDTGSLWLIINGWTTPDGYNHRQVSLALLIPPNYPDTQIDMAYFRPALTRIDGKPIGGLADQTILGESWQRWSRHRTASNPWRPSEDGVASHLGLVDDWLRREFEKA